MLARTLSGLRNITTNKNCYLKMVNVYSQQKLFSAKPPVQLVQELNKEGEQPQKKPKKPEVPKITLIAADEKVTVTTLEEAQHLSKRRDLKLVKMVDLDTKTHRPVYKLMSGTEYHAEELKQREERKKERQGSNALKGEKLLMLNYGISKHDLETNIKKVMKWIAKKYEVRVVINGDANNTGKAESVYQFLEETLKEHARILQKRTKGNDLKFQIIPPKDKDSQNNPKKTL